MANNVHFNRRDAADVAWSCERESHASVKVEHNHRYALAPAESPLVGPGDASVGFKDDNKDNQAGSPYGEEEDNIEEFELEDNDDNSKHCCCFKCALCALFNSIGKHALGIILILCVTVIWVASSAWIQYIFGELEYEKPYFMTFFNTAGFTLWNLGYIIIPSWRRVPWNNLETSAPIIFTNHAMGETYGVAQLRRQSEPHEHANTMGEQEPIVATGEEDFRMETAEELQPKPSDNCTVSQRADAKLDDDLSLLQHRRSIRRPDRLKPYSKLKILKCASLFCPLWFIANYLFNLSLSRTSVASNTVLSSTSSIWTLLLSVLFLGQRVTVLKVGAVLLGVGGSAMIAFSDGKNGLSNESVVGDILALVSAFFYATYTSILKWCLPEDERFRMGMVFGMVGVFNLLFMWPGLPIVNATGFEHFKLPTPAQLWPLVLNTLIGTNLSDVLWARSVVLTSPVVATLGLSLTTPLAMVVDAVWKKTHFSPLYVTGAVLVMIGFVVINIEFGGMSMKDVRNCWHRLWDRIRKN